MVLKRVSTHWKMPGGHSVHPFDGEKAEKCARGERSSQPILDILHRIATLDSLLQADQSHSVRRHFSALRQQHANAIMCLGLTSRPGRVNTGSVHLHVFPASSFHVADSPVATTVLRPVNPTPWPLSAAAAASPQPPRTPNLHGPHLRWVSAIPSRIICATLTSPGLCVWGATTPRHELFPASIRRLVSGQSSVRHSPSCSSLLHFVPQAVLPQRDISAALRAPQYELEPALNATSSQRLRRTFAKPRRSHFGQNK
ncbi:hypothetical protein NDU88_004818 [Pleurodeles waltl]|uniref:Uncharacterized protein n=1 Tax=Pleurodeles waltl TaxID=8319 RepID=A0AAV7PDK8_PLEWA|nr:hypothetical protein NDU88_004818 [Pleurodeles waltl]